MQKEYYCRQKFLFEVSCDEINLEEHYASKPDFLQNYTEQINLFDDDIISRSIDISELDTNIDTLSDFENLISCMKHVQTIYIINSRSQILNPIIDSIQTKSLKAYIWYFEKYSKNCKIIDNA